MIFSLSDFFGYSMAVTSACDYLNLSPGDFHNWEVRLDGVRICQGFFSVKFVLFFILIRYILGISLFYFFWRCFHGCGYCSC